jgi:tRNA threonylcarbamoyladenosine dehydratase
MIKIQPPKIYTKKKDLPSGVVVVEYYKEALRELFFINNPKFKKEIPKSEFALKKFLKNNNVDEVWIYFPWRNIAVHTVSEDNYFKLRTARNKNIITEKEQKSYRESVVGIIGMSIGSASLSSLVATGGPKNLKIADFDTIEISNLNRMHATLLDVGKNKCIVAAQRAWELDPFANIEPWQEEIKTTTAKNFIIGKPKLNVLVDAMDTLDTKVRARIICRKNKIPVVMATSNGDSAIIDVERFDLEPNREFFHGSIGEINEESLKKLSARNNYQQWLKMATKIVDPKILSKCMRISVKQIGKTIAGVPQIGTTVNLSAAAVSYVVRKITSGQEMPSGRYLVDLEEKLTHK